VAPPRSLGSSQTSRSRRAQGEGKLLVRRETENGRAALIWALPLEFPQMLLVGFLGFCLNAGTLEVEERNLVYRQVPDG